MTTRRNNPGDTPWVTIAAVVGVIAVVVIALVFFLGGSPSGQTQTGLTTKVPTAAGTMQPLGSAGPTVKPTTPVVIPVTGVFVKVSYLGGFNGTYGMNKTMQPVKNSGTRVYEIINATGSVTATFFKQDGSTHDITVELFKNGKSLISAKNSTPFGKASIIYTV
jgi:hypothetical protein